MSLRSNSARPSSSASSRCGGGGPGCSTSRPQDASEPYSYQIAGDWARAASYWRESGCRYQAALALADSHDGKTLRQALDGLQALGARPAAAIIAGRLRKLGERGLPRGPRPKTRANPAGLTARELEVLGLLAEGLRNAQIAERLVLSGKTVRLLTTYQRSCTSSTSTPEVKQPPRQRGQSSSVDRNQDRDNRGSRQPFRAGGL